MTCKDCRDAESNPVRDGFTARCRGCEARALASIGAHIESQELGSMTPHYRATLERVFGSEWKHGAELVKQWAGRIAQASAARKARAL